jgi:hypothetical protein
MKMASTCAVCWSDMDMKDFEDPRASTETCYKLHCGHAYHTTCIIEFLTRTKHECPLCNKIKDPKTDVPFVGYVKKVIGEVFRLPEIALAKQEFNQTKEEYRAQLKILAKDMKNYVSRRVKELKLNEYRAHYFKCQNQIKNMVKAQCTILGNKHVGAFLFKKDRFSFHTIFDHYLSGERHYYRLYRLRHPRLHCQVFMNKQNNGIKDDDSNSDGTDNQSIRSVL